MFQEERSGRKKEAEESTKVVVSGRGLVVEKVDLGSDDLSSKILGEKTGRWWRDGWMYNCIFLSGTGNGDGVETRI